VIESLVIGEGHVDEWFNELRAIETEVNIHIPGTLSKAQIRDRREWKDRRDKRQKEKLQVHQIRIDLTKKHSKFIGNPILLWVEKLAAQMTT
jgi:hypothetical protein